MLSRTLLLLALFAAALFALAVSAASEEDKDWDKDSKVPSLTKENFDEMIKSKPFALVEYYATWCPHCKRLAPEYEKLFETFAAKGEAGSHVLIAKVNADKDGELAQKAAVQGFPTIKLYKNGEPFRDYEGERNAEGMEKWLLKKTGSSVQSVATREELDKLVATGQEGAKASGAPAPTIVLGAFPAGADSAAAKGFAALADRSDMEDFVFVQAVGKEAAAAVTGDAAGDAASVKLVRDFEPREAVYAAGAQLTTEGDAVAEAAKFVRDEGFPLVDEVNAKSFRRFADSGAPLAVIFLDYTDVAAKKASIALLEKAAAALKGKFSFGHSDGKMYGQQLEMMGGDASKLPGLAAMDIQKRKNFPFPAGQELTADGVLAWAQGILDGSVAPFFRSQPVPESNDGPVKIVVGKNFESLVLDADKDVLVEFYAPWCGHCKRLEPVYEKLGKFFSSVDNLVIAKSDATENDFPGVAIEGFPTIYFYPAGGADKKAAPVTYEGNRTLKDLKKFLRKHATVSKDKVSALIKDEAEKAKAKKDKSAATSTEGTDAKKEGEAPAAAGDAKKDEL